MRLSNVTGVLGLLLRPFAVVLLAPAAVDLLHGEYAAAGTFAAAAAAALGISLVLARHRVNASQMSRVEAMAVVAAAWLMAATLGAVPYIQQSFHPLDALFESMSGFTTTGSTIFHAEDFDRVSRGLMFWRCMTQWIGGMGIIVLFVAVLPALAVAGRQMFFAEAPGPEEEALTPRIRHTAMVLWRLYVALTAAEVMLLWGVGGMTLYESICHAFTTLAAGGFSPNAESLQGYGAAAQWIVVPFMFLAGASFSLQFRALRRPRVLALDTEFRVYAGITVFAALIMAVCLAGTPGHTFATSLRHGFFQAASILTTTGYASEDFALWQAAPLMVLGTLMFIGGCAGSAGGGPKVVRIVILAKFLAREVLTALHPRVIKVVRIGHHPIQTETLRQIVGFLVAYVTIFAVAAILAGMLENDITVGFTGAIVTLGNIGPGFGKVGPMATFGDLGWATKTLFIFTMWVGRLEVMTVLVLFSPEVIRGFFFERRRRRAGS